MSVTSGFFNSLNHDRLYDAEQLSSIFDGIIKDGVYMGYKDALIVKASDPANMTVIVGEGRAWFDHTWTLNDADLPLIIDTADVVLNRIDTIVIDVDATEDVRACTIIVVKGTPASQAVAPTLINETDHHQYPLCDISIPSSSTSITQAQITNRIGTSDCPFVTGIIETIDIDDLVAQWQAQWNEWKYAIEQSTEAWTDEQKEAFESWREEQETTFENWEVTQKNDFDVWFAGIQDILDGDTAGKLYNLINDTTGINATATYSGGVVAITGPENVDCYTFLAPSDWKDGDTYTINETSVTLQDLNGYPVEEGWKQGSPISFWLVGTVAFFKISGGINDTLPELLPNFEAHWVDDETIILIADMVSADENPELASARWVYSEDGAEYPDGPRDGIAIELTKAEITY